MTQLSWRGEAPELHDPVLVVALTGWIDASGAAAAAMDLLVEQTHARSLVTFDDDAFIDYRARRPVMEVREGLNTRLVWNVPELHVGTDRAGRDVLLLIGPEPDMAWRRFATLIGDLAEQLGVRMMVGLGAYPFAAPHTRPSRVSLTTPSPEVLARLDFLSSSVDVPAGTEAVIEHELHQRGIDAVGLWAQVPHYVAAMAYPAATAALLEALVDTAGLDLDVSGPQREAMIQRHRLDGLVSGNDEHAVMLRQLEAAYDESVSVDSEPGALSSGPLPSGDELAREVEQFLREQGGSAS